MFICSITILELTVFITAFAYAAGSLYFQSYQIGWEGIIVVIFIKYVVFSRLCANKVIFSSKGQSTQQSDSNENRRQWFCGLYAPYLLYSIWYTYWMTTNSCFFLVCVVPIIWISWIIAYQKCPK